MLAAIAQLVEPRTPAKKKATIPELEAQIAQLQAAVHTLIAMEVASNCPQSTRGGTRMGHGALPALEPFVTMRDQITGRITRLGVGDHE